MNLKEIKDAARQAFSDQQTQDTEGGVPDIVSFCAGFVAGARYRQGDIPENEFITVSDEYDNVVGKTKVHSKIVAQNRNCYIINRNLIYTIPFYYKMQEELKSVKEL